MKEIKKNNFLYKRINIFMFLNIFYYYFNKKNYNDSTIQRKY